MDRHDRLRPLGNGRFQKLWIQVVSFAVDVHEYRFGFQAGNAARGGYKGKRRGDDFIPGIDAQSHEREQYCVRP